MASARGRPLCARLDLTGSTRLLQRWTADGFTAATTSVVIEAAAFAGDLAALAAHVAFRHS